MNTQTKNVRTTVLSRPRFSILQVVIVALLLTVAMIGGCRLNRSYYTASQAVFPATSYTLPDPSMADTGRYAWIVNPMRAVCAEWESDSSRYAWLADPLKEGGLTPSDVLGFCERLANAG